jgi:hypothetical protein
VTLRDDLATFLAANAGVAALATGGVLKQKPDSRVTPGAFDQATGRLQATVVVAQSSLPREGTFHNSATANYAILCYAPTEQGAEEISAAIFAALNDQQAGGTWWTWTGDTDYLPDDRFEPAEYYIITQYEAPVLRGE